ncbi:MAG: IS4 family transposase [Candidatus Saccharimonas sp.]|nr:IS4 family transposase [Planctomycetaceae bacterium]
MRNVTDFGSGASRQFQRVVAAFLSQPGLPFASVLSAERVQRIFGKHQNLFAMRGLFSTVNVLWAFLGQVLRDGKQAACQAAVAAITAQRLADGLPTPTSDTGDYCKARAKLSEAALRELTVEIADELEERSESAWLWKGLHAKLVDGFTFTMPDTSENQAEYPQSSSQKKGVGLPIARCLGILSLATAAVLESAIGPYSGKETGETALLRTRLDSFSSGDLLVADRYFCSFFLVAMLLGRGVQSCTRMHQKRHFDFRRGRRLGARDHLVVWTKPPRPQWMAPATYETIPETMTLRELQFQVIQPGYRTQQITIVTTLTDAAVYSKADIAELYGFRWNAELDIRAIKQNLNLNHVRCKSPEMVRRELWTTLLAYNLVRTTAAAAALLHDKRPRQISFTSTCQYVLTSWTDLARGCIAPEKLTDHCLTLLSKIAECEVAHRPGRIEPRVLKRRRHGYKLMQHPRHVLKKQLISGNAKV